MTSVIDAPVYEAIPSVPAAGASSRLLSACNAMFRPDDAVDLDEHRRLGRVRRVVRGGRMGEREWRPGPSPGSANEPSAARSPRSASRNRVSTASEPSARASGELGRRPRRARRRTPQDGPLLNASSRRSRCRVGSYVGLRSQLPSRLPLELRDRAKREVQDLDWMPATQKTRGRVAWALWLPRSISTSARPTMSDLLVSVEDRLLVARMCGRSRAGPSCARRRSRRRPGAGGSGASSHARRRSGRAPSRGRPSQSHHAATRTRPHPRGSPSRRRAPSPRDAPSA